MSNVTVQIIRAFPDKTPIPQFEGKVIKVHPRKTGTNSRGEWSMQRVVLRDRNGEEITALLTEHEEFAFRTGEIVVLACKVGDKGSTGVYVHDDTYNDKTERQIKVTATGRIDLVATEETAPAPAPDRNQGRGRRNDDPDQGEDYTWSTEQAPPRDAGNDHQTARDKTDVRAAKKTLVQIVNLHTLCVLAVDRVEAPLVEGATGAPMSDSQRQAAVASVFIKAERSGLVDKMPAAPFKPEDIA